VTAPTRTPLDAEVVRAAVDAVWDAGLPTLVDYIRIPAKSPAFDADWVQTGHLAAALEMLRAWSVAHAPPGATVSVHELPGLTPVLLIDVAPQGGGRADRTVLIYGHLDKQPEMEGWRADGGPWVPIIEEDRLYGRGGADDGYSTFAAVAALAAVAAAGGSHARCVVLIEASEESGSPHLLAHLDALAPTLGEIDLVVCLDSGCLDYEHLWVTTSLRGLASVALRVEVLTQGQHSGAASGAVPSSMRIMRQLLDRVEDAATGRILVPELHATIPEDRRREAAVIAAGLDAYEIFPLAGTTRLMRDSSLELLLATTWEPTLSYIGADGLPRTADAGNVLRPSTTLGLSFRLPPTVDAAVAADALVAVLTADPPAAAAVTATVRDYADGWNAAPTADWLGAALAQASSAHFGAPACFWGEGGSIPFMAMLGQRYPDAQFVVTGALGPDSNAHGPDEYLHLPTARRISACVSHILDAHASATHQPS
jgi:acetylornithine deacetylase/succinyl-diaminopimelate desuccinylase-like protein